MILVKQQMGALKGHKDVVSRALKEASERKAKKLHFYQNGKPYHAKLTVSLIPGKDFTTFEQLCQFLTEKTQLLNGVQYIFTTNGKSVYTLDELEHGQSYVMSGTRHFMSYSYGQMKPSAPHISHLSNRYKFVREDDLRLIRPLSSKYHNVYSSTVPVTEPSPPTNSHREHRVVTIVNNQNHHIFSKVILNLKSPKSFELLLQDLGHAVQLKFPKRLFTSSGLKVHSVSQLKHELPHVKLFYIDSECPNESLKLRDKSHSLESIDRDDLRDSIRPMASYSSNIELRPNQIFSHSSLSSNPDLHKLDKKWNDPERRSRVNSFIDHSPIDRTPTSNYKRSRIVPIKSSPGVNRAWMPVDEPEINCNHDNPTKFSLEYITPQKYEQIQRYAEKLLNDASVQIHSEGLLHKSSVNALTADYVPSNVIQSSNRINSDHLTMVKTRERIGSKESIIDRKLYTKQKDSSTNKIHSNLNSRSVSMNKLNHTEDLNHSQSSTNIRRTPSDHLIGSSTSLQSGIPVSKPNKTSYPSKSDTLKPNVQSRRSVKSVSRDKELSSTASTITLRVPSNLSNGPTHVTLSGSNQHHTSNESNNKKTVSADLNIAKKTPTLTNRPAKTKSSSPLTSRKVANPRHNAQNDSKVNPSNQKNKSDKIPTIKTPGKSVLKGSRNLVARSKNIKPEKYLRNGVSVPQFCLELEKILGYYGSKCKNLHFLTTGELAFHTGNYSILWNPSNGKQRFYEEHSQDIGCMRVDHKHGLIATSQAGNNSISVIKIWSINSLNTMATLSESAFGSSITDMEFTLNNSLFVVSGETDLNITLWNWRTNKLVTSASKPMETDEKVFGLTVHPIDNDIIVTYGNVHLMVWHFKANPHNVDCRTALQTHSKLSKSIFCADFLQDNSLLTGDSSGNLTIWAPFEVNKVLEFAIKEVKGHESQLNCLKLTSDNILISGDKDGIIKTWDVSDGEFRLLNAVKLPALSGAVCSITLPNRSNDNLDIFVGTSASFILKGSALQTTNYEILYEGHLMAIRTISFDPREEIFYTSSLDQKVCKWNRRSLIWRVDIKIQGISSAVHRSGEVLAVGSVSGVIAIVDTDNGNLVQFLQLTTVCIGCMSYSPDGNFLVAGCQDGNLHVLPVTENGRSYDKVSILKGPLPILTLQWSMDTQFILTSVDDNNFQELILWDLPNTRYIRNVTNFSENLRWFNGTCSGLEDARGTWDNEQLTSVVNICKHYSPSLKYIVTGDEKGSIRLFSYPCYDTKAAFFEYKQGGGSVTDVKISPNETFLVACNFQGMILLWKLRPFNQSINDC